jgi:hypothetical protein
MRWVGGADGGEVMDGVRSETQRVLRGLRTCHRNSDENCEFDECAKPSRPLSADAERILGVTNEPNRPFRISGFSGLFIVLK